MTEHPPTDLHSLMSPVLCVREDHKELIYQFTNVILHIPVNLLGHMVCNNQTGHVNRDIWYGTTKQVMSTGTRGMEQPNRSCQPGHMVWNNQTEGHVNLDTWYGTIKQVMSTWTRGMEQSNRRSYLLPGHMP